MMLTGGTSPSWSPDSSATATHGSRRRSTSTRSTTGCWTPLSASSTPQRLLGVLLGVTRPSRRRPQIGLDRGIGGVPERSNGAVLKTVARASGPWVRIPPPPLIQAGRGERRMSLSRRAVFVTAGSRPSTSMAVHRARLVFARAGERLANADFVLGLLHGPAAGNSDLSRRRSRFEARRSLFQSACKCRNSAQRTCRRNAVTVRLRRRVRARIRPP
jgi:hypothetical protein